MKCLFSKYHQELLIEDIGDYNIYFTLLKCLEILNSIYVNNNNSFFLLSVLTFKDVLAELIT